MVATVLPVTVESTTVVKPTHGAVSYAASTATKFEQESFQITNKIAAGTNIGDNVEEGPALFRPYTIKNLTLANRIIVAPMCMYSSKDGFMNDFHLAHLGSFAIGGAGLVIAEATAVEPRGRISPADTGIWSDDHIPAIKRVVDLVHAQGSKMGIQLGHAGRKASTKAPYNPESFPASEYWADDVVGPTAGLRWDDKHEIPRELLVDEIPEVVKAFADGAIRANKAGMDTVEIHGAHGYLIHQFLSPVTNKRTDHYGGSLENRARLLLEIVKAVRANFPAEKPVFLRLSASDCVEHLDIPSWTIDQTVEVSRWVRNAGVDVVHISSAGNTAEQKVAYAPGYQVHFAERVKKEVEGLGVIAVGSITNGKQSDEIVAKGRADLIAAARSWLKNPAFALEAARELGVKPKYASQYFAAQYV
ncbi:hypothetical protein BGZ81_005331 [Podila clonocystis]|nr:hypothetical protein BGZ81_005331 [Podila clonocystis]